MRDEFTDQDLERADEGRPIEEDAAEAAQETFVRLYQHRAKFDSSQRFSTWLYAIATNLVKDRYRYRTRHPQVSLDAEPKWTASEVSRPDPAPTKHRSVLSRFGRTRGDGQKGGSSPGDFSVSEGIGRFDQFHAADLVAPVLVEPGAN